MAFCVCSAVKQWWFVVNRIRGNKFQWILNRFPEIYIQGNALDTVVGKQRSFSSSLNVLIRLSLKHFVVPRTRLLRPEYSYGHARSTFKLLSLIWILIGSYEIKRCIQLCLVTCRCIISHTHINLVSCTKRSFTQWTKPRTFRPELCLSLRLIWTAIWSHQSKDK